jgi:hypothetical protein
MKMKGKFMVLLLCLSFAFILVTGCTTPATTPAATTAKPTAGAIPVKGTSFSTAIPDLVGNWNGTSRGYVDTSGYQIVEEVIRMDVVEQNDRLFKGQLYFPLNGTMITKEFAGVLGADGKTIEDVEYPGGFSDGVVISADEIELIFRDQANPSTITIDSLKRSTAASQVTTSAVTAIPSLLGKWNGTATGYMKTSGYQLTRDVVSVNFTEQKGRLFRGQVSYVMNKTLVTKEFAGVFGRDGVTFKTIENPDGFSDGIILSADEIELSFRDNADPSRVVIDSLKRSAASSQVDTPASSSMPGLLGNWSGISSGYMQTASGYEVVQGTMTMKVTEQTDRLFKGQIAYMINGTLVTKEFAGVFGRGGQTMETVEYPDGFSNGVLISADEVQLVFWNTANPSEIAIDIFKRS